MATWMEKDVLIEFISHVVAVTARDVDVDNKDVISLLRLQNKLYGLSPEEIDYKKEVDFIKEKKLYQKVLVTNITFVDNICFCQ